MNIDDLEEEMRAEFLAAFRAEFGFGAMTATTDPDAANMLKAAAWAWQASRKAVVVELPVGMTLNELRYGSKPKPDHARLILRQTAVVAIEAEGLKVKP